MRQTRLIVSTLILGIIFVSSLTSCSPNLNINSSPSPQPSPVPTFTPQPGESDQNPGNAPKACTLEAKICPDGSTVGRTGPNCEFAACPPYSSSAPGTTPVLQPADK